MSFVHHGGETPSFFTHSGCRERSAAGTAIMQCHQLFASGTHSSWDLLLSTQMTKTKIKITKIKRLVSMAFLNKALCTYFSTNLRFIFPVPAAAHLRAGMGCREQRLEQLELLCHLLGTDTRMFWHCCSHGEWSQPSLFGSWHLHQRACSTSFTCSWC